MAGAAAVVTIVDFDMGNLRSVVNAFEAVGARVSVTREPRDLRAASAVVLPGVGSFDGFQTLRRLNFVEALNEEVLGRKKPYLGICLGLQFLGRQSFENGCQAGLGWIPGDVVRIEPADKEFKVPHIGWNNVQVRRPSLLFRGLGDEPVFYFVHSYHLAVDPDQAGCMTATCWHGADVTASIERENIFGVQFHPEKSQEAGLGLLRNFLSVI